MSIDNKTCAERIDEQMQSRNIQLEEIYDRMGNDEDSDDQDEATNELHELALEISEFKVVKILLSTGGPGDWIEVTLDENDYIRRMEYHFHDWFDHAKTQINDDTYLWQYAQEIIDTL